MNVVTALLPLPSRNRGAALLLLLLFMVIGFTAYLMSSFSPGASEVQRQRKTLEILALAKEALIGYAVAETKKPGRLPCPDVDNDGKEDLDGTDCSLYIGRLPWNTLAIEKLTDGHGEQLWYAVSDNFHSPDSPPAINSGTEGTLELYAADGSTLLTKPGEKLAAIVFSPGPSLSGKNRSAASNDAQNYLDSGYGRNNASAAGPFIAGPVMDAQGDVVVNDLAMGISAKELLTAVEKRVLGEIRGSKDYGLCRYYAESKEVPWASPVPSTPESESCDGRSYEGTVSGCLPYMELIVAPSSSLWLTANGWLPSLIVYERYNDSDDGNGDNGKIAGISVGNSKMVVNFGASAICQ